MEVSGENRAQRQYKKRKQRQHDKKLLKKQELEIGVAVSDAPKEQKEKSSGLEIEYVAVDPMAGLDPSDPNYAELAEIARRFSLVSQGKSLREDDLEKLQSENKEESEAQPEEEPEPEEEINNVPKKLSKRQKRLAKRIDIATLKTVAKRADLVEIQDTTAKDPELLVNLKAYRNTVPVPRHWSQKRKYLQGKRGIEKIPYQLPDFIRNTGIAELRQAALDRAEAQKLKAKQRERLRPKMGQMAVEYTVMRDAFFRYQTKPSLTFHGELYYEGKEFEPKTRDFVAGVISENLQKALGMPEGAPPPWLFAMQNYGPPPSYPGLRVPGVNAPIPEGSKYGFHPGGWGKPPLGADGRPLWGWADALLAAEERVNAGGPNDYDTSYTFGAMLYAEDYEDEDELEDEQDEDEQLQDSKMDVDASDAAASSSAQDKEIDMEDGDINLRKFRGSADGENRELFQVLEQRATSVGNAAMGSSHVYRLPPKSGVNGPKRTIPFLGSGSHKAGELEITLDPSDFELSEEQLRQKYERLYNEFERKQQQPSAGQLSEADRDEMMRRSLPSSKSDKPKDKSKKDYVKF